MAPATPIAPPDTRTTVTPRGVERIITGKRVTDGAGVAICRVLTQDLQRRLDPFLLLDIFGSDNPGDYIGGFPDHPHRGFETVTFMLEGRMRHRDSAGHEGLLENGGVQWMTAGRGVIHSEMPEQENGRMEGFQLWLNLPAQDKLCAPWYRDFASADLPRFSTPTGADVQVIAGSSHGLAGAVQREASQVLYLAVSLAPGGHFSQPIPPAHNAFVCAYRGQITVRGAQADTPLAAGQMAILDNSGSGLSLHSEAGGKAIVLAAQPLHEAIVQYGPFVMNSEQEIRQAIDDYRAGVLG